MTHQIDLLGRPPVMRQITHEDIQHDCSDWRGEHIMRNIQRSLTTTFNVANAKATRSQPPKPRKLRPAKQQCGAPDCSNELERRSVSGVCKGHLHSDFCKCVQCRARELGGAR